MSTLKLKDLCHKELLKEKIPKEALEDNSQIIKEIDEKINLSIKYENILNSIDEGVYVVDTEGFLLFYNPALEKLEGFNHWSVLGKHVTEIYPLDWETSLLLKVIITGKPILDYYQEYFVNDRPISIICNTVPVYANGVVIGAASIVRDFSRFKEMVEKNLDLQEKLINRNNRSGNKSHDKDIYFSFRQIIGENTSLKECIKWGEAAAKTESPVFIYGETGTGKELFAQSIHLESPRSKGPFLGLNVAAIPETLLEGILFGTSKGAFTGAINRVGMLEQANSGTLFLDEINSMPIALQAKLLRVLEEKKIRRLGDNEVIPVDVRIISSCNVDPTEAIEKGQLRSDLFYRLAVVYLTIPPLRERMDDLEMLADAFIQQYNHLFKMHIKGLSDEVLAAFRSYHWPGNIRQLKHCIECAMNVVSKDTNLIDIENLPKYLRFSPGNIQNSVFTEIEDSEKNRIKIALKKNNGNIARAAVELGVSRQNLQYRIKKYNLK
ncbi:sigma-54 interaction domain-containing protein [Candidatus Formimonas warabiya]|uniref:sigma-54 interaction domain-containing protein n=1 Tax=Formimonas warabiya TaxID=1761012 RepID=UPI001F021AC8|nr:sigma 54-interacting transcriptional regulator [Candidatus Formimonas warabiya]